MPAIGKELRVPKSPQAKTPDAERSDAELLSAVAADRCRASFAEVVKRYERPAYNIALNITRSAALAEEAAQEAMLRVWLSAHRFDPEGSARGWLLGIVAREALKKVRDRRKDAEKVIRAAQLDAPVHRAEEPAAEQKELLATLQKSLEELPELNRQLVALYYGAGMSQAQVGESVDLSQRMVGYKLEETLKLLRSRLAQAGLAAAAPALGSETLAQAVCSGYAPPAHLCASVMARLDSAVAHAAEASARVVAAKGSSALLWAAAVVAVAAAAGGGWYALQEEEPGNAQNAPAVAAPPSPPASSAIAAPAEENKPFHRVWNFNDGPSPDFFAWANPWEWQRERDGVGRMIAKRDMPVNMFLDVKLPKRPLVLHFRAKGLNNGQIRDNFFWADHNSVPAYKCWSLPYGLKEKSNIDLYFIDRYIIHRTDGQTWLLYEFEEPYPAENMIGIVANFRVEEIEIRELSDKEVADFAFDAKSEIARMERLNAEVKHTERFVFRGKRTDAENEQEIVSKEFLSWLWSFNDGFPKDLRQIGDGSEWVSPEGDRPGEFHVPLGTEAEDTRRGVLLPVKLASRPCEVEIRGRRIKRQLTGWGANVLEGTLYVPATVYKMTRYDPKISDQVSSLRFYLHGTKGMSISDQTTLNAIQYDDPTLGKVIAVAGRNLAIQRISLRYIDPKELPVEMQSDEAWETLLKRAVMKPFKIGMTPVEKQ